MGTYSFKIFGFAEKQGRCLASPNPNERGGGKVASLLAGRSVTHLSQGNKE